jgi:uncharacterized membrane protein YqjE
MNTLREPIIKILTRLILYGLTSLFAWIGVTEAETTITQVASGLAVLIFLGVAQYLDRLHNKWDREEVPKATKEELERLRDSVIRNGR